MDEPSVASQLLSAEDLAASPYAQEWGRPQGITDFMDLFLLQSPTRLASLGFGRHERYGPLTNCETGLAALLIPHLRRTVTISNALEAVTIEKARLADTLNALTLGVVLTDDNSQILHANRTAESMMRDGSTVRGGGGRLQAENVAANAEIKAAIEYATRNESEIGKTGLAVRLSAEKAAPVIAHVLPLARGSVRTTLDSSAVAAVFISQSTEDSGKVAAVASAFHLTAGETRVLARVPSGRNAAEAAGDLGIATSTVRTHLENIFSKTGVSRQTELLRLVACIAPATLSRRARFKA